MLEGRSHNITETGICYIRAYNHPRTGGDNVCILERKSADDRQRKTLLEMHVNIWYKYGVQQDPHKTLHEYLKNE